MTGHAPQRVNYVVGTYPSLTTTFIDREVEGLLARGVDVAIVSIRRPHTDLSPRQREMQARVRYLLPPRRLELVRACASALLLHPWISLWLLAYLLSRPQAGGSRLRTVFHWVTGLYCAYRLRDRRGVHLHAHFVDRAATVALVASRLLGTTYSVTAHANDIYVDPVILPAKFGNATFAVTCTEYNRRHLARSLGRAASNLERIYHGLDLASLVPGPVPAADGPWLLSVGQLKEKKGLAHLLDAMADLAPRWPALRCEIVGEGPLRGDLERRISSLGLADRVTLSGALPHPEVLSRYARRPIFVLPSVIAADGDRDGIPNVILEAMAMELAVVSTDVSGIPEVVHDGETGLLVPPGDPASLAAAIGRLLDDPQLASRLGRSARAFTLANFDQATNVGRFAELLFADA